MKLRFQHANPRRGRESLILRFEGVLREQVVCVLVDAGAGVDVSESLDPEEGEHLAAICLTHAHLDHYRSLGANLRDGAPVYATPDTAAILGDAFDAGADHYDLGDTDAVLDRLDPVDDWTTIVAGVRVRPVPAGHAPGAAGFLFEVEDGDARRTVLVTGDFTARRAAGYPGFDPDLPVGVDVLVLTGATNETFEATLTDAVATAYERVTAGSTVLATASGLTGVHLGYLLGHLAAARDDPVPVTLVGHVATLHERLDYDVPNVTAVPDFADPASVLRPGGVTIAGPEVPVGGSAERLFAAIEDDPAATLLQVVNGGTDPVCGAGCTVRDFALSNHPSRETVDDVVERLSPVHVVVTHQRGRAADRYKDCYDSFVWVTDDTDVYTLLDESGWTPPPWVTEATERRIRARREMDGRQLHTALADGDIPLPSVTRGDDVDLAAEGLDLTALRDRLPTREGPETGSDGSTPASDGSTSVSDGSAASSADGERTAEAADGAGALADEATVSALTARLDRIEAAVTGQSHPARAVDAGDGVFLLRLDAPPDWLEHGDRLDVLLREPADRTD
ncbi:MBL fold metallo-hydrolase [Halomarina pelagica]|uniref:MBL fold metallo-hydrolase n=1 Tax=Halomarina pelagica TaxID=2961599 RepID=UPI0020C317C0|nr:MBL fold metallo-hydrolase [Halomarina sp. BND7]